MKYKNKTDDGVTLHWLVCDNCGISTQKYDNEDELCRNAAKAGWFVHRLTLNIFCSTNCMKEYSNGKKGGQDD